MTQTTQTSQTHQKDYCDANDQKTVVEKMSACDKTCADATEINECYDRVLRENDACMSS